MYAVVPSVNVQLKPVGVANLAPLLLRLFDPRLLKAERPATTSRIPPTTTLWLPVQSKLVCAGLPLAYCPKVVGMRHGDKSGNVPLELPAAFSQPAERVADQPQLCAPGQVNRAGLRLRWCALYEAVVVVSQVQAILSHGTCRATHTLESDLCSIDAIHLDADGGTSVEEALDSDVLDLSRNGAFGDHQRAARGMTQ